MFASLCPHREVIEISSKERLTYEQARRKVDRFLRKQFGDTLTSPEMGSVAAPDEFSMEHDIAFTFGVNTVRYFDSRNPLDGLVGGAAVVPKDGSPVHWAPNYPPLEGYLTEIQRDERDWEPHEGGEENTVRYYALLGVGRTRSNPSGVVRRRSEMHGTVDEAFTRNLRWEPTEHFERLRVGHDEVEHVEITEAEAEEFVRRITTKLGG